MTLKKAATITLEEVKTAMRRGEEGVIKNFAGFGVYHDRKNRFRYIVDEDANFAPVAFERLRILSTAPKRNPRSMQVHMPTGLM